MDFLAAEYFILNGLPSSELPIERHRFFLFFFVLRGKKTRKKKTENRKKEKTRKK